NEAAVGQVVLEAVGRYADRTAFIESDGTTVSYLALGDSVVRYAQLFDAFGLGPDKPVAQLLPNRASSFAISAAAYVAGVPSVVLNPLSGVSDHLEVLADSEAAALIVDESAFPNVIGNVSTR